MNAKTAKVLRKYAKETTDSKEHAKIIYKQLKVEYKTWLKAHG